jgi:hypothetical protein
VPAIIILAGGRRFFSLNDGSGLLAAGIWVLPYQQRDDQPAVSHEGGRCTPRPASTTAEGLMTQCGFIITAMQLAEINAH